ncbi:MAG: DUF1801 domain-containing protein [Thermoplasmatota archaeon]|nr:DUF1801 domain-containing protein [Candidatus Thermoplasmatota archaeon]MBU1913707.1 DUF1801 domain-containing protein [Candidatus Thermoplasmatota archaeon]
MEAHHMGEAMNPEVREFVDDLDESKKGIVLNLRKLILDSIPGVKELIKWKTLTYQRNEVICMILVFKKQVNLRIWKGAEVDDESGLLEGKGRVMRHLIVVTSSDINPKVFRSILAKAMALDKKGH